MAFTPPPSPPNSGNPGTFNADADAFLGWFPGFVAELNAQGYPEIPLLFRLNGTAAAPALSWNGDNDTGIYRAAANQIGFSTGGTQRARLSNGTLQLDVQVTGSAVISTPYDSTSGRLMTVGAFGWGLDNGQVNVPGESLDALTVNGAWRALSGFPGNPAGQLGQVIHLGQGANVAMQIFIGSGSSADLYGRSRNTAGVWNAWTRYLSSSNTTVDSNGFVKAASPILRLFADGSIEEPVQQTGAEVTRATTGTYRIANTLGLAATGWQIEVPRDHNGNILCHVETAWDGDVLTVSVSQPVWNEGRWIAGDAIDVPDGRWIDVRLHEPQDASVAPRYRAPGS